jgi:hypothetical protein
MNTKSIKHIGNIIVCQGFEAWEIASGRVKLVYACKKDEPKTMDKKEVDVCMSKIKFVSESGNEIVTLDLDSKVNDVDKRIYLGLAGEFDRKDDVVIYEVLFSEDRKELEKEIQKFEGCDVVIVECIVHRDLNKNVRIIGMDTGIEFDDIGNWEGANDAKEPCAICGADGEGYKNREFHDVVSAEAIHLVICRNCFEEHKKWLRDKGFHACGCGG